MEKEFLNTPLPPDLADISRLSAAALVGAARAEGFAVFGLDGALMNTKPALMAHTARALGFPGDFGANWDAMIDYLGDMSTLHKNEKVIIFIRNAENMSAADPGLYADLRKVAALACANAREWSKNTVVLKFAFIP